MSHREYPDATDTTARTDPAELVAVPARPAERGIARARFGPRLQHVVPRRLAFTRQSGGPASAKARGPDERDPRNDKYLSPAKRNLRSPSPVRRYRAHLTR